MRRIATPSLVSLGAIAASCCLLAGPPARADDDHHCEAPPSLIADSFAAFDAATSPPAPGQPAATVLAPWLDFMDAGVEFVFNNDPDRVGPAAVAGYFAPLLPFMGTVHHELVTISPLCGVKGAWIVRGVLHITRASDGRAITPIHFTDTLFVHKKRYVRYEINLDPAPLGELFAP